MLLAKAIKCGILGIVGQERASIEYGIAWCSSYFGVIRLSDIWERSCAFMVSLLKPADVSMSRGCRGRVRMGDRSFDF